MKRGNSVSENVRETAKQVAPLSGGGWASNDFRKFKGSQRVRPLSMFSNDPCATCNDSYETIIVSSRGMSKAVKVPRTQPLFPSKPRRSTCNKQTLCLIAANRTNNYSCYILRAMNALASRVKYPVSSRIHARKAMHLMNW